VHASASYIQKRWRSILCISHLHSQATHHELDCSYKEELKKWNQQEAANKQIEQETLVQAMHMR